MKELIQTYLRDKDFIKKIEENYGEGAKIILAFNYGSQFYEVATDTSDFDIQVIVKPSLEYLIMGKNMNNSFTNSIRYKNICIDLQVKSIQNFMRELSKISISTCIFLSGLGKNSKYIYIEDDFFRNFLPIFIETITSTPNYIKGMFDSVLGKMPKEFNYPPKKEYFPHRFYMSDIYFSTFKHFVETKEFKLIITEEQKNKILFLKSCGFKEQHLKNKEEQKELFDELRKDSKFTGKLESVQINLETPEHMRLKEIYQNEFIYAEELVERMKSYYETNCKAQETNVRYLYSVTADRLMPNILKLYGANLTNQ